MSGSTFVWKSELKKIQSKIAKIAYYEFAQVTLANELVAYILPVNN